MGTETKVLLSACEVFASRGYRSATTAEIAQGANANIAAISYYFRGKKNLYSAVWAELYSAEQSSRQAALSSASDASERLLALIRYNIYSVIGDDSSNLFTKIVHRELASPSPLHFELYKKYLEPMQKNFLTIIADYLQPENDPEKLRACSLCIHGPIYDLLSFRFKWDENKEKRENYPLFKSQENFIEEPEKLIENIQAFIMGGLKAIRE